MIKNLLTLAITMIMTIGIYAQPTKASKDMIYEMRVYYCHPNKLNDLITRFTDHTMKLFEKHGMVNVGYWVPIDNKDNKLVYVLANKDQQARDLAWKNFMKDKAWQKAQKASEKNGPIITKVESTMLKETDYSPHDFATIGDKVLELRSYKTTPYNLGLLNARFRNHTLALFAKYGMTNLIYWTQTDVDNHLLYLLKHDSKEAAAKSFDGFRKDQEWLDARAASEKLAKGSLTTSVTSEFLVPISVSPWK
jgi:hypothetical protein